MTFEENVATVKGLVCRCVDDDCPRRAVAEALLSEYNALRDERDYYKAVHDDLLPTTRNAVENR